MGGDFLFGVVVGADFLADVAAVEEFGVLYFGGEVGWDGVFVFDCEVGDAKAGVDDARGDYGAGGATVDALAAVHARGEVGEGLFYLGRGGWGGDFFCR